MIPANLTSEEVQGQQGIPGNGPQSAQPGGLGLRAADGGHQHPREVRGPPPGHAACQHPGGGLPGRAHHGRQQALRQPEGLHRGPAQSGPGEAEGLRGGRQGLPGAEQARLHRRREQRHGHEAAGPAGKLRQGPGQRPEGGRDPAGPRPGGNRRRWVPRQASTSRTRRPRTSPSTRSSSSSCSSATPC